LLIGPKSGPSAPESDQKIVEGGNLFGRNGQSYACFLVKPALVVGLVICKMPPLLNPLSGPLQLFGRWETIRFAPVQIFRCRQGVLEMIVWPVLKGGAVVDFVLVLQTLPRPYASEVTFFTKASGSFSHFVR
jgi:hypothetical protein